MPIIAFRRLLPTLARHAAGRRLVHIRSGRQLEHVLYPERNQRRPRTPAAYQQSPAEVAPKSSPGLVTREDLEAAWERSAASVSCPYSGQAVEPSVAAAAAQLILSVDCRDMCSEDLAQSLRAVAAPYRLRHLGAAGEKALAALRADPRLTLLECRAAMRARHLSPAQLCRLVCDLRALRCDPGISAVPLAMLNSAVNDLPMSRLLDTLWRLSPPPLTPSASARSLTLPVAPLGSPEPALFRQQIFAHLRARLHELERPFDCVSAARAACLFAGELEPDEVARLLGAAKRGAARASALDPVRMEGAFCWRPLLPALLRPVCRHLRECADGMFHVAAEDLDAILCIQEDLAAVLLTNAPQSAAPTTTPEPEKREDVDESAALAAGLRELCEASPHVVARLPWAARHEDLLAKFQAGRHQLLWLISEAVWQQFGSHCT